MLACGVSNALTPQAKDNADVPFQRLSQARCVATKDDEQAVSTAMLGPRKSKKYEIRLAAMLSAEPVMIVIEFDRGIPTAHLQVAVVMARDADEYARVAASQMFRNQTGIFQRLPSHFEQETLLRIHSGRFARRNAEKQRIEFIDPLLQETSPSGNHLARTVWIWIAVRRNIPAIGGDLADRIHTVAEELPKRRWALYAARKSAPDADDSDGLCHSGSNAWHDTILRPTQYRH